jgi:hypothetical protein
MVWRYSRPDEIDEQDENQRMLGVVVEELERETCAWHQINPRQWRPRPDEVPLVVRLDR